MNPVSNSLLVQQLSWRYATKKFDPTRKISADDWKAIEAALLRTPSSYGLQPWKFIVVTHDATRAKLVSASWGQNQVADASHLVVFAIRKNLNGEDIDRYIRRIAQVRGVSVSSLTAFRETMLRAIQGTPNSSEIDNWSSRQVYIALGNFMTSAAMLGIDTCPMEGIKPSEYDAILGLTPEGYSTVVVCAAGYRAEDDPSAALRKVRYAAEEVIQHVE